VHDARPLLGQQNAGVELERAIRERRAVRAFTDQPVAEPVIRTLIDAAIQAPSAMNAQPWAFVVIEQRRLLDDYAERAKSHYLTLELSEPYRGEAREILSRPGYDLFHGAPVLLVICARADHHDNVSDCFLAAQNLMLAACDAGLGTCPVGFARPYLDLPEIREALGVPPGWLVALPLVVGHPAGATHGPGRRPATILAWRR
jgi:nitroreductase